MFLPTEGLFAEVLQTPELVESIQQEQRVVIAGPGTFSAMLSALQLGFRTLTIEQRSSEVWRVLGQVETEFGKYKENLENARHHLNHAEEALDAAASRSRAIQRRLRALAAEPCMPESDCNQNI